MSTVIDLFSGPGGWCVGAKRLGLNPLGIEFDDAACQTRRAAGLRTMQADVAACTFGQEFRGPPGLAEAALRAVVR